MEGHLDFFHDTGSGFVLASRELKKLKIQTDLPPEQRYRRAFLSLFTIPRLQPMPKTAFEPHAVSVILLEYGSPAAAFAISTF